MSIKIRKLNYSSNETASQNHKHAPRPENKISVDCCQADIRWTMH
jgi:hypothetical protein